MAAAGAAPIAQPLATNADLYPNPNVRVPIQGHWLLDHAQSDSLKPHLQALGVSEMACLAYEKLLLSLVIRVADNSVVLSQASQLGVCTRELSTHKDVTESTKQAQATFKLQSCQPHALSVSIRLSNGMSISDERQVDPAHLERMVQVTRLTTSSPGDVIVTRRVYARVLQPPTGSATET